MTHLHGEWRIHSGQHRLFDVFVDLLVMTTCIAKAFNLTSGIPTVYNEGDYMNVASIQFDLEVHLPLVGPIELVIAKMKPNSIAFGFEPKADEAKANSGAEVGNIQSVLNHLISSIFTAFYEDFAPWFQANVEGDKSKWPGPWAFGRLVRNAMSHGGALKIDNAKAPTFSWYALSYGPNDNGKKVIGTDLNFADLLILMIEMSDDLDQRGCPVQLP